jgi:isopropylmalate/homocitrate/citramalate synthase
VGALEARVGKIAVFTAATETFNRRNVNATIAESIAKFTPVVAGAKRAGARVRGYVSTAFWCPYEGHTPPQQAVDVAMRLLDLGCDEIDVGDTIGAATPPDVAAVLDLLLPRLSADRVVLHFHDTRATALVNVMEGLRHGVTSFDSSAGGLGGCPYAPGAAGNLATEDLVYLCDGLGIATGVDLERLRDAGRPIEAALGRPLPGKVFRAGPAPGPHCGGAVLPPKPS